MAFAYPLSPAQFLDQLRVQSARFWLPESLTTESSEGGEIFTADRGPRLWQAEFLDELEEAEFPLLASDDHAGARDGVGVLQALADEQISLFP